MIRSLKQAGYTPDADKLIAMRIHGATPEWVEELKKEGYDHLVEMFWHGEEFQTAVGKFHELVGRQRQIVGLCPFPL